MDLVNDGVCRDVLAGDQRDPCGLYVPSLGEALVLGTIHQINFNLKMKKMVHSFAASMDITFLIKLASYMYISIRNFLLLCLIL